MNHNQAVREAYDYPFVKAGRTDDEEDDLESGDWEGKYKQMGCNPNYTQETDARKY
jgi:hypothetical protein